MKALAILTSILMIFSLAACSGAKTTPDASATISAAVQATTSAQAAIDAAVKATTAAQSAAAQPTAASTPTAQPSVVVKQTVVVTVIAPTATPKPATPVPTVNAVSMTEEELAALIDKAVQEAVAATTTATTTTATYAADGTLTTQEVAALLASSTAAQTEISQALALAQSYYDLYAQIATDTLATLQAIEQDLNSMSQSMAQMTQILSQGQATAQAALTQLQATATKAQTAAQNAQTKEKNWAKTVQTELDNRANAALNVQPNNVPTDLKGAVANVNTYIDTVRNATGDNKISKTELGAISQAGANANAGLSKFGGTEFSGLSTAINTTTKQAARGETQKAKASLSGLDTSAKSFSSFNPPSLPRK